MRTNGDLIQKLIREIRRAKPSRADRTECMVCEKLENHTDAHHVVSVAAIAEAAASFNVVLKFAPIVWLCPNCHALVHRPNFNDARLYDNYSDEQVNRLGALVELRDIWGHELIGRDRYLAYVGKSKRDADGRLEIELPADIVLSQAEYFDTAYLWDSIQWESVRFTISSVLKHAEQSGAGVESNPKHAE